MFRVFAGQGKLENIREFLLSGKVRQMSLSGKILFVKSQGKVKENDLGSCSLQLTVIFFASANIKKQTNLWLPLNVQKLDVFQLQGGGALPL